MRLRLCIALTLIAVLVSLSTVFQNRTTAKANISANQKPIQVKRKPIQPDLLGTVSGATNPEAIPDTVAFELFMRPIADYPSENVFKDASLHGDQIRNAGLPLLHQRQLLHRLANRGANGNPEG